MNKTILFSQQIIVVVMLMLATNTYGQDAKTVQAEFAALDSFMFNLEKWGQFRELASVKASFDISEKYKSLFMPDVWVYDNFNPKRDELKNGIIAKPITGSFKKIDEFAFDVLRYCTEGVNSRFASINADYSTITSGKVKYVVRREASITDFNSKRLVTSEVFEIIVSKDPASGDYKIAEWKDLEHTIECKNCDESFEKTVNPADDPKTRLKIWSQVDVGLSTGQLTLSDPGIGSLNREVYLNLIESRTSIARWNDKQVKNALQVGGMIEAMFGHRKQFGIASGLYYNLLNLELSISEFNMEYELAQYTSSYNRSIIGNDYRENVSLSTLSLPVMGRFTLRVNQKLKLHSGLGASINFGTIIKSDINVDGTYNAKLYFRTVEGDSFPTSYFNDNPADSDNMQGELAEEDGDIVANYERNRQAGYDVGLDESAIGSERFVVPLSFSLNARLGLGYMINNSSEIVFGAQACMSNIEWEGGDLQLLHLTSDKTNTGSILKSLNKMQTTTFGLYAGFRVYLLSRKK